MALKTESPSTADAVSASTTCYAPSSSFTNLGGRTAEQLEQVISYIERERPEDYRAFLKACYADPFLSRRMYDLSNRDVHPLSKHLLAFLRDFCDQWEQAQVRLVH